MKCTCRRIGWNAGNTGQSRCFSFHFKPTSGVKPLTKGSFYSVSEGGMVFALLGQHLSSLATVWQSGSHTELWCLSYADQDTWEVCSLQARGTTPRTKQLSLDGHGLKISGTLVCLLERLLPKHLIQLTIKNQPFIVQKKNLIWQMEEVQRK